MLQADQHLTYLCIIWWPLVYEIAWAAVFTSSRIYSGFPVADKVSKLHICVNFLVDSKQFSAAIEGPYQSRMFSVDNKIRVLVIV